MKFIQLAVDVKLMLLWVGFYFRGRGGEECLGFALAFKTWCNDH